MQHAPVAGAHRVGLHCTSAWNDPPPAAHWVWVVIAQVPLGKQHAPVMGAGHEFAVHCVPGPRNVPPWAMHCCWLVMMHWEVPPGCATQHAPTVVLPQVVLVH